MACLVGSDSNSALPLARRPCHDAHAGGHARLHVQYGKLVMICPGIV